jgi:hypothetical protein
MALCNGYPCPSLQKNCGNILSITHPPISLGEVRHLHAMLRTQAKRRIDENELFAMHERQRELVHSAIQSNNASRRRDEKQRLAPPSLPASDSIDYSKDPAWLKQHPVSRAHQRSCLAWKCTLARTFFDGFLSSRILISTSCSFHNDIEWSSHGRPQSAWQFGDERLSLCFNLVMR